MNARHIRLYKRLRPGAPFAVASRDPDRARAFGHKLGAKDCFGSYEEAFRSSYQALVIGVPPRTHADLIEAGLERRETPLDREAGPGAIRGARAPLADAQAARSDGDGRREPALRPVSPTPEGAARRPRPGAPVDSGSRPPGTLEAHRMARRPGRDAARCAARGGRPLDPASAGSGGGVRARRRGIQIVDVFATGPARPVTTTPGEDTMMIVRAPSLRADVAPPAHLGRPLAIPRPSIRRRFCSSMARSTSTPAASTAGSTDQRGAAGSGRAFAMPPATRRCGPTSSGRPRRAARPS